MSSPLSSRPLNARGDALASEPAISQTRRDLIDRLCDVVTWPTSRIPAFERDLAADLLIGLLPSASLSTKIVLAQRLAQLSEAPKTLLRYLVRDHIDVASTLLKDGVGLDDTDLLSAIGPDQLSHAFVLAGRRRLTAAVTESLIRLGDARLTAATLQNQSAALSSGGIDIAVQQSRHDLGLTDLLAARSELRVAQALSMFWWSSGSTRQAILRRFAIERTVLVRELGSIFLTAAADNAQDQEARKALLLLERRVRTRTDSKGGAASLDIVLSRLAVSGFEASLVAEVAHQSGLRAATALRIFRDPGGEALAVFAKAMAVRRPQLEALFDGLIDSGGQEAGVMERRERVLFVFDTLSTSKALGVLRTWNWILGAVTEPAVGASAAVSRPSDLLI